MNYAGRAKVGNQWVAERLSTINLPRTHSFDDPLESVELVYPTLFFKSLATTIIEGVGEYFRNNRLNPYEYYKFGSYWLDELN